MTAGTVTGFNARKGLGSIAPDAGGGHAFVPISAVEGAGLADLPEGQTVGFVRITNSKRGKPSAHTRLDLG